MRNMSESKKARDFLFKHPPKTPEEIAKELKQMEEAKGKYTKDVAILEQNIKKFNSVLDPLIDPISGDVLCWVRRPTQAEWDKMIPEEFLQYKFEEEVPPEVSRKYANLQFEMMAKLIENPKHDAEWWKANSNLILQQLFQAHLTDVYRKLGLLVENF